MCSCVSRQQLLRRILTGRARIHRSTRRRDQLSYASPHELSPHAAWPRLLAFVLAVCGAAAARATRPTIRTTKMPQWGWYGGDAGGTPIRRLTQITRDNVAQLEIAWTYRTGELGEGFARADKLAFEATPILVRDPLYLSTPTNIVIALDPATGRERWRYDPQIPRDRALRGSDLARRLLVDRPARPIPPRLLASDLHRHARRAPDRDRRRAAASLARISAAAAQSISRTAFAATERGEYLVTSPPAIYRDLVIVGSAIGDNRARRARARHRARLRRAHRRAALVVGSDPATDAEAAHAAGRPAPRAAPAPRTRGRSCPSMPAADSSSCRPARRARTSSAASGRATTRTRTRSSRCAPRRARWSGIGSSCITTCGTSTSRRSRCSSISSATANRSPRSYRRRRPGCCSCSTAKPASPSSRSSSGRCRRATFPAKSRRRRSRFRRRPRSSRTPPSRRRMRGA